MNNPIDHHYLPVFYLNEWIGPDGKLIRFHRPHNHVIASALTPKYTAFEPNLYSLKGVPEKDQQAIETEFMAQTVDGPAATVFHRLLEGKIQSMNGEDRQTWTRFLMAMHLRNPFTMGEVETTLNKNIRANLSRSADAEYLAARKPDDPDTLYEWALLRAPNLLENAHKSALPGLIEHEFLGTLLMNMRWVVVDVSAGPHSVLTGDRPLMFTHGWGDPATIIALALSPTKIFMAANDIGQLQKIAGQSARDNARNFNNLIARLAVDNVYGDSERHLAFIEKRLRRRSEQPVPGVMGKR